MAAENNNDTTRNLDRLEANEEEEGDTNDATRTPRTTMDSDGIFMEEEKEEIGDDTTTATTTTITTIAKQGDLIGHHHPPKNDSHNTDLASGVVVDAATADFSNAKTSNRLNESNLERNTWAGDGNDKNASTREKKRWSIVTNMSRATDNDTSTRKTVAGDGRTPSSILSRVRFNFDIMLRAMRLSEQGAAATSSHPFDESNHAGNNGEIDVPPLNTARDSTSSTSNIQYNSARNTWAGGDNGENDTSLPVAASTREDKRWSIVTNMSRATDNDTRNTLAGDGRTPSNILSRVRLNFDVMLRTMRLSEQGAAATSSHSRLDGIDHAGNNGESEIPLNTARDSTTSTSNIFSRARESVDSMLRSMYFSEHDVDVATTHANTTPTPPHGDDNATATSEGRGGGRRTPLTRMVATIFPHVTAEPVRARLVVEEEEGQNYDDDVVFAERVSDASRSRSQRRWKVFASSTCFLLVALAVSLSMRATLMLKSKQEEVHVSVSDIPTMEPSAPPSYDPRPMLEIVRERGYVRCGLQKDHIESEKGLRVDLCRAVAAVLFGDPDSFVGVSVTGSNRFEQLNDWAVDLLLYGDTHTIEREVNERSTGAGFTFSSPYYYDGMAYAGDESFVKCAEEGKRFDECASLLICVIKGTTGLDFVHSSFPYDFIVVGDSTQEVAESRSNGTCNVIADDRSFLLDVVTPGDEKNNGDGKNVIVGDKLSTKEPLAFVTRNNDREFSDIVNWVLHALFYGEEQGLTKNPSLCQNDNNSASHRASDINFMNAVYCVGNYGEVFDEDENDRGMNLINNGTTGMLYATPFGRLKNGNDYLSVFTAGDTFLDEIRGKRSLNCGVVVPEEFDGQITNSSELVGMSVDYCRALAAGLFNGCSEVVNWSTFSENDTSAYASLDNGTIDVLAGGRVEKKYDFESSSSLRGFQFSTPYYFGNETAGGELSSFSLVTREDDALFTSFVNIIVLATIYAQEKGTKRVKSQEIWGIRDAIAYSSSYDVLYIKNFGNVLEGDRGRNTLNKQGGPQLHSFPGLVP